MIGSKTAIDRLGLRLKHGDPDDDDLKALDAYRRSFEPGYETVIRFIRDQLRLESTGRPAKSTTSVVDKLRRESIRLSQIQDIAGCRVIVPDLGEQERVVGKLSHHFVGSSVVDRRSSPSHGYRAVHVIVVAGSNPIEIQVRSRLQHLWAEVSERLSDSIGIELKYGVGPPDVQTLLISASQAVAALEENEERQTSLERIHGAEHAKVIQLRQRLKDVRQQTVELLEGIANLSDIIDSAK